MDKQIQSPTPPEKVKVLVNLDNEVVFMADAMVPVREAENRSDYIRRLIRADYRREQRRQQRMAVQA